ncbi:MAG TPA: hypothetical protein VFJ70_23860 [Burkholderiales bacterium]|nr:hypothetical protein [Burkholderiales bacterium]
MAGSTVKGTDVKSVGPSDTSDSGSDMAGPGLVDDEQLHLDRGTNEDPEGTGEHLMAGKEPRVRANQDRETDRVVRSNEAGLGSGLDQAEQAQRGVTDEALARRRVKKPKP